MKLTKTKKLIALVVLVFVAGIATRAFLRSRTGPPPGAIEVPAGIAHESYDRLLKKYVDAKGLVAYGSWKSNPEDLRALDDYLRQFESKPAQPASGDEKAASLVNLYNALTVRWILKNYPTASIQALNDSFGVRRHNVGGQKVSLNDIEHSTLRPLLGYRAHAVLVCAARSCPPLQRFAYTAPQLDAQIEAAFREWLARDDLNHFEPHRKTAQISSIFTWFAEDFEKVGGVKKILATYGPQTGHSFLAAGEYEISYLPYDWGLNDQSREGQSYSRAKMIRDRVLDFLTFWN
jgi:hypothetical protein